MVRRRRSGYPIIVVLQCRHYLVELYRIVQVLQFVPPRRPQESQVRPPHRYLVRLASEDRHYISDRLALQDTADDALDEHAQIVSHAHPGAQCQLANVRTSITDDIVTVRGQHVWETNELAFRPIKLHRNLKIKITFSTLKSMWFKTCRWRSF